MWVSFLDNSGKLPLDKMLRLGGHRVQNAWQQQCSLFPLGVGEPVPSLMRPTPEEAIQHLTEAQLITGSDGTGESESELLTMDSITPVASPSSALLVMHSSEPAADDSDAKADESEELLDMNSEDTDGEPLSLVDSGDDAKESPIAAELPLSPAPSYDDADPLRFEPPPFPLPMDTEGFAMTPVVASTNSNFVFYELGCVLV